MSGRTWLAIAGAAVLGILVVLVWPRRKVTPEQLVEQHCVQMVRAAESRDVAELMTRISEKFRSRDGLGRQEIKGYLARELLQPSWVRIFMTDLVVDLEAPDRATAHGKFVFGRSDATSLRELAKDSVMSAYALDIEFAKEGDGEWRVVGEKHRVLPPEELITGP